MTFNIFFLKRIFYHFFPTATLPPFIYTSTHFHANDMLLLLSLYYIRRVGVVFPRLNTRYACLRVAADKSKSLRPMAKHRYYRYSMFSFSQPTLRRNDTYLSLSFITRKRGVSSLIFYTPFLAKSVCRYLFREPVSCARRENCPRIYPWRLYFITSKIIVIILPKLIDIGVHLVVLYYTRTYAHRITPFRYIGERTATDNNWRPI